MKLFYQEVTRFENGVKIKTESFYIPIIERTDNVIILHKNYMDLFEPQQVDVIEKVLSFKGEYVFNSDFLDIKCKIISD